jgi:predicted TIM-barrel fold metal-dependent hydrolase
MSATYYNCHAELARLPHFELEGGRLVLADRSGGPAIDAHTHLALAYLLPMRVDLWQEHPRTEHYLSTNRPLDLEVYANRNFPPVDVQRMKWDLTLMSPTSRGMRATHTIPNLLREMREMNIERSVLLPIDMPILSSNALTYLSAAAGRDELLSMGSVHPFAPGVADKLDRQLALGARGVKVHPATQLVWPDHPRAMHLYRLCGERGLPILFHCGPVGIEPKAGRRRSQVRLYEPAVAEHPGTTFILGHSGALQMEQALALARRYDNVYLELSSQSLSNVRRILERAPEERVLFGSDWPFYHQSVALAKVLLATEGAPRSRRRVLRDNAARLLGLA